VTVTDPRGSAVVKALVLRAWVEPLPTRSRFEQSLRLETYAIEAASDVGFSGQAVRHSWVAWQSRSDRVFCGTFAVLKSIAQCAYELAKPASCLRLVGVAHDRISIAMCRDIIAGWLFEISSGLGDARHRAPSLARRSVSPVEPTACVLTRTATTCRHNTSLRQISSRACYPCPGILVVDGGDVSRAAAVSA